MQHPTTQIGRCQLLDTVTGIEPACHALQACASIPLSHTVYRLAENRLEARVRIELTSNRGCNPALTPFSQRAL